MHATLDPMSPTVRLAKIIVIMSGSALISFMPEAIVMAMPALAQEIDNAAYGELIAKMIVSIPGLMVAVGAPIGGLVAIRWGIRPVLLTMLALYALAGLMSILAPSLYLLAFARLLLGFAGGAAAGLMVAVIADFPARDRQFLVGLNGAGGAGANILALLIGGLLLDFFGWRGPFALYLLAVPILVVAWVGTSNDRPVAADEVPRWAMLPLWASYLVLFLLAIGFFVPAIETPFILAEIGTTRGTSQGLILTAYPISSVLFSLLNGALRRFFDTRAMTLLCFMALGLATLVLSQATTPAMVVVALVLAGVGGGLSAPTINSILLDRAPPHLQAGALGLVFSAMYIAQSGMPLLLEVLRDTFGRSDGLVVEGLAMLALGMIIYSTGFGQPIEPAVPAERKAS